jgi:hypothetical protein
MKNNYIYIVMGTCQGDSVLHDANLGFWLSLGTAKADIKRMMANGILDSYRSVRIEQVQIGRYHMPVERLNMKKINNKWVNA